MKPAVAQYDEMGASSRAPGRGPTRKRGVDPSRVTVGKDSPERLTKSSGRVLSPSEGPTAISSLEHPSRENRMQPAEEHEPSSRSGDARRVGAITSPLPHGHGRPHSLHVAFLLSNQTATRMGRWGSKQRCPFATTICTSRSTSPTILECLSRTHEKSAFSPLRKLRGVALVVSFAGAAQDEIGTFIFQFLTLQNSLLLTVSLRKLVNKESASCLADKSLKAFRPWSVFHAHCGKFAIVSGFAS